jgi:diaminopimelate decarboxylase
VSAFAYAEDGLCAEGVPLARIAEEVGTPAYVYAAGEMRDRYRAFARAFRDLPVLFCYAVKANSNLAVIRLLAAEGAGADVVSGGELERALAAGVPASRIVFAGVGKTREEMAAALDAGVLQFNVESIPELVQLGELAAARRIRAPVALRVNPDVAAGTHDKISTGRRGDKCGIPLDDAAEVYALASRLAGIELTGLHLHIGSQITSLAPFEAAYECAVELFDRLRRAGHPLRRLDLGGGFGVRYRDEPMIDAGEFAGMVRRVTAALDCELVFEPGRALVADAGVLLARVIYLKESSDRRFLVIDAGMNTFLRPAMYDAWHGVLPVREAAPGDAVMEADIVGPICESSDVLARGRALPELRGGDLVVLSSVGAYGAVMASDYNSRASAAEVLVDGDRFAVVKRRRLPRDQFADESVPDWLDRPVGQGGDAGARSA